MELAYYLDKFSNLSVKITNGQKMPNKAIMLISIIDLIRSDIISENRIYLNEIVESHFKKIWSIFINDTPPTCWTPFWHLKTDEFWHFKTFKNIDVISLVSSGQTLSIGKMRQNIEYAYFDVELFNLINDSTSRNQLMKVLLDVYIK